MGCRHFHKVYFVNHMEHLRVEPSDPADHPARRTAKASAATLLRAMSLYEYVWDALRDAKVVVTDPPLRELLIRLTINPSPIPELWLKGEVRAIYVDVLYDGANLATLPLDNTLLGELFIGWVEEALGKLSNHPRIPSDVIRDALAAFRTSGYTYRFKLGERTIPGTKLKGRIDCELSCVELVRTLTLSYRGRVLLKQEISRESDLPVNSYRFFSKFYCTDHVLRVQGAGTLSSHSLIYLNEYPEVLRVLQPA